MKKKKRNITIGALVLLIFAIAYIPSLISWIYGTTIDTSRLMNGVVEDSIATEGVFVRDEEVILAPFGGRVISELSEGEKVASSTKVATVLKESANYLYGELNKVESNIIELQKEKTSNIEVFSEDIAKLDNEIGKKLRLASNEKSLLKVGSYNDEIDKLINKKVEIMGGLGSSDSYLKSKLKERDSLKEQIRLNTREIYSKFPGIISYSIDDYESVLKMDNINKLTPKMLEDVVAKDTAIGIQDGRIDAEKAFAKVIKGLEYCLVASVEKDYFDKIIEAIAQEKINRENKNKENDKQVSDKQNNTKQKNDKQGNDKKEKKKDDIQISIRIKDLNKTFTGLLVYQSEVNNGKYVIGIKTDKYLSDTVRIRKMNIDIIKKSYSGLKVSLKSLKNIDLENKKASIFVVKGEYASERTVDIDGYNNEFAIIKSNNNKKPIALYDMFVLNPTNIKDGEMIKQ